MSKENEHNLICLRKRMADYLFLLLDSKNNSPEMAATITELYKLICK